MGAPFRPTRLAPLGCGAGRAHPVRVLLDRVFPSPSGKTHAVAAQCLGRSSRVRGCGCGCGRVCVRVCVVHLRACACACARSRSRAGACACACARSRARACAWECGCACVYVRVCVGAGRRDYPLRRAGVFRICTVGLGLGRQRILCFARLERLLETKRAVTPKRWTASTETMAPPGTNPMLRAGDVRSVAAGYHYAVVKSRDVVTGAQQLPRMARPFKSLVGRQCSLPLKDSAADSDPCLRRSSFFRRSMRLSDVVSPSSAAPGEFQPECGTRAPRAHA